MDRTSKDHLIPGSPCRPTVYDAHDGTESIQDLNIVSPPRPTVPSNLVKLFLIDCSFFLRFLLIIRYKWSIHHILTCSQWVLDGGTEYGMSPFSLFSSLPPPSLSLSFIRTPVSFPLSLSPCTTPYIRHVE